MWPGYWSHEFGIEQHNVRLQPRRRMIAAAADGCKPVLDGAIDVVSVSVVSNAR